VGNVAEIRAAATEALDKLEVLQKKAGELQDMARRFGDLSQLKDEDALKLATEGQDMLATLNDCTRARKCNLVPYQGQAGNLIGQRGKSKVEPANNGGCCAGQTGHHLIPEASLKAQCPNYDHNMAPTVCVEGFSQNHGSHQRAHQALAKAHMQKLKDGKVAPDGSMSMGDAIDSAADSHKEAFPLSNCSKACIKEQLESYYKMCSGARPQMVDSQAKPVKPPAGTGGGVS
jgi:hypothetical protein